VPPKSIAARLASPDVDGGIRVQRSRFVTAIVGLGVLTACGTPADVSEPAATADPATFCATLAEFERATPPEPGGNNAEEFAALLAVSDQSIADDVETLRDYHRDVYVEGDPDTDTYDHMPADLQAAIQRVDAYAAQHCEDYTAEFD
jgi:hypothetical protein